MFERMRNQKTVDEAEEKEKLSSLSEKELLIEVIIELKKLNMKCVDIARKIVI